MFTFSVSYSIKHYYRRRNIAKRLTKLHSSNVNIILNNLNQSRRPECPTLSLKCQTGIPYLTSNNTALYRRGMPVRNYDRGNRKPERKDLYDLKIGIEMKCLRRDGICVFRAECQLCRSPCLDLAAHSVNVVSVVHLLLHCHTTTVCVSEQHS